MNEDTLRALQMDDSRRRRVAAFFDEAEEPTDDLGEILLDAQIASAGQLDESIRAFQSFLIVRLSGGAVQDGWIDNSAQGKITSALSREIEAAAGKNAGDAQIGLVGVGAGSVLLFYRPRPSERSEDREPGDSEPIDLAMQRVIELHALLERRAPAAEITSGFSKYGDLLKQARGLIRALSDSQIDLSTRWWSSTSSPRRAVISSVGRQYASELFEVEPDPEEKIIQGIVTGLELDGFITITPSIGRGRTRVSVGEEIHTGRFVLGEFTSIVTMKEREVDKVGQEKKVTFEYLRPAGDELLPTDET